MNILILKKRLQICKTPSEFGLLHQGWGFWQEIISVSPTCLNVVFSHLIQRNISASFQVFFRGTWSTCSCRLFTVFFFFFLLILFLKFLLEYNCFTMLCQFLLYNKLNQLYVCIYSYPLESPSHPTPYLRSSQSTLSWAPCVIQQLPASYLF